jgi:hypothetical protein
MFRLKGEIATCAQLWVECQWERSAVLTDLMMRWKVMNNNARRLWLVQLAPVQPVIQPATTEYYYLPLRERNVYIN